MKPIKLKFRALGPYEDEVTIDFNVFNDAGLFLITGPTGGGKTFLFDAITYALYGESSGSQRENKQLRCIHASEDVTTYVELEFEIKDQIYKVKRCPEFKNETNKQSTKVILTMPNGVEIDRPNKVKDKIVEITKINAKQFKQIVMIAQGDFNKLILTSSSERADILRALFNTSKYENIHKILEEQKKVYDNQRNTLSQTITNLLGTIDLEDKTIQEYISEKEVLKKSKQETLNITKKNLDILKRKKESDEITNKRIEQIEQKQQELVSLTQQEQQMNQLKQTISILKEVKEIQPTYQQYTQCINKNRQLEIELTKYKDLIQNSTEDYSLCEKNYQLIPRCKETITSLEKKITQKQTIQERYRTYQQLVTNYNNASSTQNQAKQTLESVGEVLSKTETKIKQQESLVNCGAGLYEQKANLEIHQKEIEQKQQQFNQLIKVMNEYNQMQTIHSKNQTDFLKKEVIFKQKEDQYNTLYSQFLYNQAGILASSLHEGMNCPVCGSTHHPILASASTIVNEDSLNEVKSGMEEARQIMVSSNQQALMSQQQLITQKEIIEETINKLTFIESIESMNVVEKQLEEQLKITFNQLQNCKQQINSLKQTQEQIEVDKQTLKNTQAEYNKQQEQYNQTMQLIQELTGKLSVYQDVQNIDTKNLSFELNQLTTNVKRINSDIEQWNQAFLEVGQRLERQKTIFDQTQKQFDENKISLQRVSQEFENWLTTNQQTIQQFQAYLVDVPSVLTYDEQYQEYLITFTSCKAAIAELQKDIVGKTKQDITVIDKEIDELEMCVEQGQQQLDEVNYQLTNAVNVRNQTKVIESKKEEVDQKFNCFENLFKITSGTNKYLLSFERYILAVYFDQILGFANHILDKLTVGRYELCRRKEKGGGRGQQGLDLDVLDKESGEYRPAKTLSGGETFKAALSLALGLSQMIQSTCGGIELQTLFIDEGFGSLDQESLNQAMECLMEVQGNNKLVGIISHVAELKEKIDNKIIVEHDNKTSRVRIETI